MHIQNNPLAGPTELGRPNSAQSVGAKPMGCWRSESWEGAVTLVGDELLVRGDSCRKGQSCCSRCCTLVDKQRTRTFSTTQQKKTILGEEQKKECVCGSDDARPDF